MNIELAEIYIEEYKTKIKEEQNEEERKKLEIILNVSKNKLLDFKGKRIQLTDELNNLTKRQKKLLKANKETNKKKTN